ncbi:WD40/YVTN/BNR-like repeat-containing protein [Flavimarina sp. Hel_I_48]|uniref:WD40/YVTN/BNR-like repeat-containing protein n=1 Tax=Flavimarina sp. Hel_I_48 TaxID=1392488 RepID=UPI0004DF7C8C|nr:oxidoreductase [Flavimarina sp. Hel_I_48]
MRVLLGLLTFLLVAGCAENNETDTGKTHDFQSVAVDVIYEDSVSIRTLEILDDGSLAFAGSDGKYGLYDPKTEQWNTNTILGDTVNPSFRATAHTSTDFFMLSIGNPALLYKTGDDGRMQLVYAEENPAVFYDSMKFWNDEEGIAMGDPTDSCLSIIITRDGGKSWNKITCDKLPEVKSGEAAFAASNTNIATVGNKTWIITGGLKSRVFYSPDKGETWEVYSTPIVQGTPTQGGYSIDFYDENTGFVIGGDYTQVEENKANKMSTQDGGKTWQLVAENKSPGYTSCVQFVPQGGGNELVAIGSTGISFSADQGESWKQLSDEGFHTFRFISDSTAYAAGDNRIAHITFQN